MMRHGKDLAQAASIWARRQRNRWLFGCLLIGATVLSSCSSGDSDAPPKTMPVPRTVLFIGNSFTGTQGGLAVHVKALAASMRQPRDIAVEQITQDGATLVNLRQDAAVLQAIRAGGHDVVVLQDDVPEYGGPGVDPFKVEVRAFNQEILAKSGRPLLFMAWAYERLTWISQAGIAAAHKSIGLELAVQVAPVGLAFEASKGERPALAMLSDDREHETLQGMYLAACVLYATLFRESPEGASYVPLGVSADDATFLQRVAWKSVSDWNAATATAR